MKPVLDGNVVTVGGRSVAWYRMAAVQWGWQSEADRDAKVVAAAQVLAALVGRRLHFRVTTEPATLETWAARLVSDPVPAVAAHVAGRDLSEKAVFVGVDVGQSAGAGLWAGLWGRKHVADVAAVVARPGFDARPLAVLELEWLLRRSIQLGHPSPSCSGLVMPWDADDMAEIDGSALWDVPEAYGKTVQVTVDGATCHVVTSVVGRMATLTSTDPWLCITDRLPYPVEISATVDVLSAETVQRGVRAMIMRAQSQREHYGEHNMPPPHTLQAGIDTALEVQAELDQGFGTDLSTRCHGWYRLAVSGGSEAEALARAAEVADLFNPAVTIVRPPGQYALAREFVPGSRLSSTAYRRRMPVTTAAGAMPQATAAVGHRQGWYIGFTTGAGGRRAALWDPWRSMETRERSGLAVVVGGLGAGKSSLLGRLAYGSALSGVPTTVLDPSGPLAALCYLPEFVGTARHIDLLSAAPGILNPRRLIPIPERWNHPGTDAEWAHAVELAVTQARTLAGDVLMSMLPAVIREQPGTLVVVKDACRQAALHNPHDWSPRHVLDELRRLAADGKSWADQAQVVADLLSDLATLPAAQLIFDTGTDLDYAGTAAPLLTVITMNGIQIPREDADRRDLSTDEILSLPLLQLSSWMVQRSVYHGDRDARKMVVFDEVHALSRTGAGRLLLNTSARDSRKWNARVVLASQNAADLTEAGVANLVDTVWVGRTEDPDAQREALRLLRVPEGCGYEAALAALSPHSRGHAGRSGGRDFVVADGEGGIEKVRVDLDALPLLARAALDTTPTGVHSNGKVTV